GANAGALVGGEDDEADAFVGKQFQRDGIDGGFREPHAFGHALKAVLEVGDAPANLGEAVAGGGQRQDDVVVHLGHGRAVTAEALLTIGVGIKNFAVDAARVDLKPGEEGGAEVEAHAAVVVENTDDTVLGVDDAGGSVGSVALSGDALIPIVIGSGGVLRFYGFKPGILAGRLIEVAMNADIAPRRWLVVILHLPTLQKRGFSVQRSAVSGQEGWPLIAASR